jgi:hypothetical protein
MSAQEADSAYIEPLDYEDSAEQEPYIDTIMDEVTEPTVAQPQQTPSVQPSSAVPPTAQSLTLAQESLTQAAQSKLTDVNLGGLSKCKIDPLKAGNWISWKTQSHKFFRLFEITNVVHGTEIKPEAFFLARRWLGKDGVAQALITNNIDDQQMNHVVEAETSAEMWENLQAIHETVGSLGITTAKRRLLTM